MKILVITSLFPNRFEPTKATFNRQHVYHLSKLCELKVIAPVPWAPPFVKSWKHLRKIPYYEVIDDIEVFHPRYIVIPKIGRALYGFLFLISIFNCVHKIQNKFNFDCIFALWAYPDGFASVLIAKILKKPILIQFLGTDINEYINSFLRKKMIAYTVKKANAVTSVSNSIKQRIINYGIPGEKIVVNPNGIDTSIFYPISKDKAREKLGLSKKTNIVLFIGNLIPLKGIIYLINAIYIIRKKYKNNILLIIIGEGPIKDDLEKKVKKIGISDNVKFKGIKPHIEIPLWINSSDLLCLPSLTEGMPNVILESLACEKPVIATNVGGIPEIIKDGKNGILVRPCDSEQLANSIITALNKDWDYSYIKHSVERYSWKQSAVVVYDLLIKCLKNDK